MVGSCPVGCKDIGDDTVTERLAESSFANLGRRSAGVEVRTLNGLMVLAGGVLRSPKQLCVEP